MADIIVREGAEALTVVRKRYWGRWLLALFCFVVLAAAIHSVLTAPGFMWNVFADQLFSPVVLRGLWCTVYLTVLSMVFGIVLGIVAALMRQSRNPIVAMVAAGYIWVFRGTPVLVQVIIWYNLAALYPELSFGIPGLDPIVSVSANAAITPLTAALLGLGLNEGAYMAEIVRAGLLSVDPGQREAAHALGMTQLHTLRRIVLPQALRIIVPPTGNEAISMLKATSLVSIVAIPELLYAVQGIYSRTFQTIPLLLVACFWYLGATTVLSYGQGLIERRLGRGHIESRDDGLARLRHWVFGYLARRRTVSC
ncbi:amino acid ABC transporter permease [soil metagenome]